MSTETENPLQEVSKDAEIALLRSRIKILEEDLRVTREIASTHLLNAAYWKSKAEHADKA